jgi:peptidoglycan/LPS O-acetylase OafA/YrhL
MAIPLNLNTFPLYITHYPLIYVYTAWVTKHHPAPVQATIGGAIVFVAAVSIAFGSLKLYDEPVRRWLSARFLQSVSTVEPTADVTFALPTIQEQRD